VLVGCDGTQSAVRQALFPHNFETYKLPIRLMGLKVQYPADKLAQIRQLDPICLQGTASENNSYVYFSSEFPFFVWLRERESRGAGRHL
jgi:2-polyprenyl-6-methoxyphenol hydroxylase-like FAD-dependent oxidoreductase